MSVATLVSPAATKRPALTALEPRARDTFALLVLVVLGVQLLQMVPVVFPGEGGAKWDSLIFVPFNLLPKVPGSLWVFWYAQRRAEATSPALATVRDQLIGYTVFAAISALLGLLARWSIQGTEMMVQTMQWRAYWISTLASTPVFYTLYYVVARFALAQQQAWTAARLAEAEERARREADSLRVAAELRMLRTYLQPHFLFNSLNTIASLIEVEPGRARNAVVLTSDLLRSSLSDDATHEDLVPLRDELAVARLYLSIEQLRMDDRLKVREEISPDAQAALVPRFAVQTLVENAVRHGLFPHPSGGTVTIRAQCSAGQLVLSVRDTGAGTQGHAVATSTGLGLRSLRERLRFSYGGRATLLVETEPDRGFCVTVTIPTSMDEPVTSTC